MKVKVLYLLIILVSVFLLLGCTSPPSDFDIDNIEPSSITTFTDTGNEVCTTNGKPIIRLYSTTWCPHCKWVNDTYNAVMNKYIDEGKIIAHHWEIDIGDDVLTPEIENSVPASETAIFAQFNSKGSIPTYVMGCKYVRIGNGFETQDDKAGEAAEFMAVIEALIADAN